MLNEMMSQAPDKGANQMPDDAPVKPLKPPMAPPNAGGVGGGAPGLPGQSPMGEIGNPDPLAFTGGSKVGLPPSGAQTDPINGGGVGVGGGTTAPVGGWGQIPPMPRTPPGNTIGDPGGSGVLPMGGGAFPGSAIRPGSEGPPGGGYPGGGTGTGGVLPSSPGNSSSIMDAIKRGGGSSFDPGPTGIPTGVGGMLGGPKPPTGPTTGDPGPAGALPGPTPVNKDAFGQPLPPSTATTGGFGAGASGENAAGFSQLDKYDAMLKKASAGGFDRSKVDLKALNDMTRQSADGSSSSMDANGKVTGTDAYLQLQGKAVRGEPLSDTEKAYLDYRNGSPGNRTPYRRTNNPDGTSTMGIDSGDQARADAYARSQGGGGLPGGGPINPAMLDAIKRGGGSSVDPGPTRNLPGIEAFGGPMAYAQGGGARGTDPNTLTANDVRPAVPGGGGGTMTPAPPPAGAPPNTAGPGQAVGLAPTTAANSLLNQTITPGAGTDRYGIAQSRYNDMERSTEPDYQAAERDAARRAAATGGAYSGQLRTGLGDLAYNRDLQLNTNKNSFLNDALEGSIGDAYRNIGIAQQQQGFQRGQQNDAFGQDYARTQLGDQLKNSAFGRGLQQLTAGSRNNPADTGMMLSQIFGQQATGANSALSNLIRGRTQQTADNNPNSAQNAFYNWLRQQMANRPAGGGGGGIPPGTPVDNGRPLPPGQGVV